MAFFRDGEGGLRLSGYCEGTEAFWIFLSGPSHVRCVSVNHAWHVRVHFRQYCLGLCQYTWANSMPRSNFGGSVDLFLWSLDTIFCLA